MNDFKQTFANHAGILIVTTVVDSKPETVAVREIHLGPSTLHVVQPDWLVEWALTKLTLANSRGSANKPELIADDQRILLVPVVITDSTYTLGEGGFVLKLQSWIICSFCYHELVSLHIWHRESAHHTTTVNARSVRRPRVSQTGFIPGNNLLNWPRYRTRQKRHATLCS